jgi:hypothetical protein
MATHRKSNRHNVDLCGAGLRKRASNEARSFFDSDRATVLNVGARLVIGFMKQQIVELSPINHFSCVHL